MSQKSQRSIPPVLPETPVRRKPTIINYRVFQHAQIQGIPEVVESKKPFRRLFWLAAVIGANVACFIHLYFLLQTFYYEPNETTITFERVDVLSPPNIIVCQPTTRFLDPESVANITAEQYYALELGVGLIHLHELHRLRNKVNISEVQEWYQRNMKEYNNSAADAYFKFHEKHMRSCEATFFHCSTGYFTPVNCCEVFKPVFTLYGMCYASRNNSISITGSDALANFLFHLNFTQSTRPNFFPRKSDYRESSNKKIEAYDVGFVNGLDQGNFLVEHQLVLPNQWVTVNMVQKQSTLLYFPKQRNCIPYDLQEDYLDYFQEYTPSNCRWEKALLKNLTLLHIPCELPLVKLLNSKYNFASSPCTLEQIFDLFGYAQNDPLTYTEEDITNFFKEIDKIYEDDFSTDLKKDIAKVCNIFGNRTDLPNCNANHLLSIGLPEDSHTYNFLHIFNNNLTRPLERAYGEYLKDAPDSIDECVPLCNTTGHWLTISTVINEEDLEFKNTASITMQYTTKNVEKITESPRQSYAEYLAQIGGNIGMWNGASLLALGHLLVLSIGALGYEPFNRVDT